MEKQNVKLYERYEIYKASNDKNVTVIGTAICMNTWNIPKEDIWVLSIIKNFLEITQLCKNYKVIDEIDSRQDTHKDYFCSDTSLFFGDSEYKLRPITNSKKRSNSLVQMPKKKRIIVSLF